MNDTVLIQRAGAIATLSFNRPAQLNALNDAMMFALRDALLEVEADANIRVVVLKGEGKAFMAGGDVAMFHERRDQSREEMLALGTVFHESIAILRRMGKPVLASVQGACAGGGLAVMLACDLAVAAESSQYTLAYARIGATPDGGSTHTLSRIVGLRKAMELALLPDTFGAVEAARLGLVNWVVPDADLAAKTHAIAERLAAGPAETFARTKALLQAAADRTLGEQLAAEAEAFSTNAMGWEFKEGVAAFVEKRKPNFQT
jgi:2-(1,2-epoxy-1,2-dihydrophenyl)acetyl-CoA isomerase